MPEPTSRASTSTNAPANSRGDFKLNAEEFRLAALEFTPVSEAVELSATTAENDSASYSGQQWGSDAMGQAFEKDYLPVRKDAISHGKENAKALDTYRQTFVDTHDVYVTGDEGNADSFEGIHNGHVTIDGKQHTIDKDGTLPVQFAGSTATTTDDVANQLNELSETEENAREEWLEEHG